MGRNKDSKNRQGNLLLTNEALENLRLKSLSGILTKCASKKRHISRKIGKLRQKTGQFKKGSNRPQFEEIEFKYQQKLILDELKRLTRLVKKLEKKVAKIERKLANKN